MPHRVDPIGLRAWTGQPYAMPDAHLHADVELNLIPSGRAEYLVAGQTMRIGPGKLHAFWGAIPHQLTAVPGVKRLCWVTVGLRELISWRLPSAFTGALLAGDIITGEDADGPLDTALMDRWAADWSRGGAWREQCAAEVSTRLHRLALVWGERHGAGPGDDDRHAPILVRVALYVAEHYREPITASDIAASIGVHAKYLSSAFAKASGMGVHHYLTRMRLGHAQHLLRTSQFSVTAIALDSGFGSLNSFYTAFRKHIGLTPERWRTGEPARFGL